MVTYFPFIVLFHDISAFILSLTLISFSVKVLYSKIFHSTITVIFPLMTVYFIYILIAGLILFSNSVYTCILWRPEENIYNAHILYILGVMWNWILFSNSIIEIFICIERIALILLPVNLHNKIIKFSVYITLLSWIISLTIWSLINDWFDMAPKNVDTQCMTFACLVPLKLGQRFFMFKLGFVFVNIVACGILLLLFKFYMSSTLNYGNKNFTKTIIIIMVITTLTDLLPNIITGIGTLIFNTYWANYVGPYNITLYGISMTICSRLYSKALLNNNNNNLTQIHVSMQNPLAIRSI